MTVMRHSMAVYQDQSGVMLSPPSSKKDPKPVSWVLTCQLLCAAGIGQVAQFWLMELKINSTNEILEDIFLL